MNLIRLLITLPGVSLNQLNSSIFQLRRISLSSWLQINTRIDLYSFQDSPVPGQIIRPNGIVAVALSAASQGARNPGEGGPQAESRMRV